ncbi:unnamed protein product [Sympodiomycopsis kandeliae]
MSPTAQVAKGSTIPGGPPKDPHASTDLRTEDADLHGDQGLFEAKQIAHDFLTSLDTAFSKADAQGVAQLFRTDGWYKEYLALQWDHRAKQGPEAIAKFLSQEAKISKEHTARNFVLEVDNVSQLPHAYPGVPWIMAMFKFETDVGRGRGVVRLAKEDSGYKAHALFLGLEEIKGHEVHQYATRPSGVEHGEDRAGLNWQDRRHREQEFLDEDPQVLIVGAGQSGLMLAYRLGALNVPTLIVDKNERIGDNWRKRYASLVLHDPCQYNHFAGMPFPSTWPLYAPKDKIANWMTHYAETFELNSWMQSEIIESAYDNGAGQWTLKIHRNDKGQDRVIRPKHIVLATGHSGEPNRPSLKGEDIFQGPVLHSSQYTSGGDYKGQNAIVVGSNNSGMDLALNLVEHGKNTTVIQRSETYFMSTDAVTGILLKGLWSDPGPKTEDADLIFNSMPNHMHVPMQVEVAKKIAHHDRQAIDGLTKAGFKVGKGVQDAGFLMSYYIKGGGYYLGTGAEDQIINGRIKMKQGQEVSHLTKDSIVLQDGTSIPADLVVLATGYTNMQTSAVKIFGKEGERMRPIWNLDEEGELNTVWRPSGHPGLWAQAGNLALNREMSKRLALNLKARLLGIAK